MKKSFKHYLLKSKYILTIVIFVALIGFVGDHCIVKRIERKSEIAELEDKIAAERAQFEKDKVELERLKTNEAAVKEVAHQKYLMKTSEEDIFVIEDEY